MLSIDNLSARYGQTTVLDGFSQNIVKGGSYALIGPSGCGKSTLVKILRGIHKDFTGNILYQGKPFFEQKVSIGYVPQSYGLLNWKTVKNNIYLPFKLNKDKSVNPKDAQEILQILEIEDLLDKYPLQLSGGQRQRVALARAFIYQPDLLLMDEPFSSLDSFTSSNSQELYLKLWKKYGITTIIITHSVSEAITIGQDILLMNKVSGHIVEQLNNICFLQNDESARIRQIEKVMETFKNVVL